MKMLDMADKYPPAEDFDDEETTIKMHVPTFLPKVIVEDKGEEFDLHGVRDTIPCPPSYPNDVEGHTETTYPGVGLLMTLAFSLIFWGTVGYFIFR